jgi:F0F1-type ATP synthase beta subunit
MSLANNGVPRTARPGRVKAVRGSVVEAEFREADRPAVYESLRLRADGREVFLDVSRHISPTGVRAIVLGHPEGLARGITVNRTGGFQIGSLQNFKCRS